VDDSQRPRAEAARLLAQLCRSDPARTPQATDVDELARQLAIDVEPFHPATRSAGTLGWLEPGENLIFLRDGLAKQTRRFTLAHEIGHFVLHREHPATLGPLDQLSRDELLPCDHADLESPLDALTLGVETLRPGQAYSARARRESEANLFAAALLLPADALLDEYLLVTASRTYRSRRLRALCERFGVSEDVLLRRLTALLLPTTGESRAMEPTPQRDKASALSPLALDPWQLAAARSKTPALVVAGPGTGKTSTLVGRVAYLVEYGGVAPNAILALTFSNRAANEMRERVQVTLAKPPSDVESALPTISTIHAFCGDLLRRYAPLVGLRPDFRLVSETDGYFILRGLASRLALQRYSPLAAPALHFPAILAAISRAKDELCGPEEFFAVARERSTRATSAEEQDDAERMVEIAEVYAAYQSVLAERGDADFGDLVRLSVRLLREHQDVLTDVQAAYQQVLVDEFQDINRAMGVLLSVLTGEHGPLWAVGDADQAIYRFRGASPANLANFAQEYPGANIHALRRNYRSVPAILDAAAGVASGFLNGGERAALESARAETAEPSVMLASGPNEEAELAGLANAIVTTQASGVSLGRQVVLCRTRRQCHKVADALRARDIPVHVSTPLLEQEEVKDVLAVVSLLGELGGAGLLRAGNLPSHPFTRADAHALLATARRLGVPPVSLLASADALSTVSELSHTGRKGLQALGTILRDVGRCQSVATGLARYAFGNSDLGRTLLDRSGADDPSARARAAALAQLLARARTFEDAQQAEGTRARQTADWAGFLDYLRVVSALRQETGNATDEVAVYDVEQVRVLTVHASKGLEFPVVYVPGLADRRFPLQRRGSSVSLPEEIYNGDAPSREAHLSEEACLFYVAVTRARDALVLSNADRYGKLRSQPSPFLAPLLARLGTRVKRAYWETGVVSEAPTEQAEVGITDDALPQEALRVTELETYKRCPRQYAYRYVYGLRTDEIGLATLRRTLHDTLQVLQSTFETAHHPPSLDDAMDLFERHWTDAIAQDRPDVSAGTPSATELSDGEPREPFSDLYHRHGQHVVERMWEQLADESAAPARQGSTPSARFDQPVTVRVNGQDISLTLDRVEGDVGAVASARVHSGAHPSRGSTDSPPQPVRIVRHRLGRGGSGQTELRELLYTLAAEQSQSAAAEVYSHNLSTGEMHPIAPDRRKLARLHEELDEVLSGIRHRNFPARPDPNTCQNCPFLLICPA
jgi:superfamily I DNA/RNA helicase/Zn-dependent peptidase ImmA (M78 family)